MVEYSEEYPLNDSSVQHLKKWEQAECPIYSPSSGTFIETLIFLFFFTLKLLQLSYAWYSSSILLLFSK